jgi:hypothetical protein
MKKLTHWRKRTLLKKLWVKKILKKRHRNSEEFLIKDRIMF